MHRLELETPFLFFRLLGSRECIAALDPSLRHVTEKIKKLHYFICVYTLHKITDCLIHCLVCRKYKNYTIIIENLIYKAYNLINMVLVDLKKQVYHFLQNIIHVYLYVFELYILKKIFRK